MIIPEDIFEQKVKENLKGVDWFAIIKDGAVKNCIFEQIKTQIKVRKINNLRHEVKKTSKRMEEYF